MCKLKAGEVAVWATERAIQILGGNGYTREFPVERWHRDAKIYTIFEGTSRDPAARHRPRDLRRARALTGRLRAHRRRADSAPVRGLRGNGTEGRRLAAGGGRRSLAALLAAAPGARGRAGRDDRIRRRRSSRRTPRGSAARSTPRGTDTTAIVKWGLGTLDREHDAARRRRSAAAGPQTVERARCWPAAVDHYSFELVGQQGATQFPGGRGRVHDPRRAGRDDRAAVLGRLEHRDRRRHHRSQGRRHRVGGRVRPERPAGLRQPRRATALFPAGTPAGPVSVRLTGLEPGTTYRYRLVVLEQRRGARGRAPTATFTTRAADAGDRHRPRDGRRPVADRRRDLAVAAAVARDRRAARRPALRVPARRRRLRGAHARARSTTSTRPTRPRSPAATRGGGAIGSPRPRRAGRERAAGRAPGRRPARAA